MFKRIQSGNASIFLVCFLLSFFIWLVIALNSEKVYSLQIPIEYDLDNQHIILNNLPDHISISTSGEVANLMYFQRSVNNKPIRFNIRNLQTLDLKSQNDLIVQRMAPFELHLIQNHNNEINIELDSIVQKDLFVKSQITASADPPYSIIEEKISPKYISVKGPSSILFYIDSIYTSKTELKSLSSNYTDSIFLIKSLSNKLELSQDKILYKAVVSILKPNSISLSLEELGLRSLSYDSLAIQYYAPDDYLFDINDIDVSVTPLADGTDTLQAISTKKQLQKIIILPY